MLNHVHSLTIKLYYISPSCVIIQMFAEYSISKMYCVCELSWTPKDATQILESPHIVCNVLLHGCRSCV